MQIEKGKGARAEPWGPLTVTGQGNEEEPAKEREKPVMWEELGGQGVWAAKSEQRCQGRQSEQLSQISWQLISQER